VPLSVDQSNIIDTVRLLGLSGKPLCVHSSLRSFGWVEGGGRAVVDALLAEGCTLLVPTFTWFGVPPPAGWRLERNGVSADYRPIPADNPPIFTVEGNEIAPDMGAIPAAVLAQPQRVRGYHPVCSFAAAGPLAGVLIQDQKPLDVFAPLRTLAERDGTVVMMGVGLTRLTLLHLAEQQAGRNMFRRWALGKEGRPIEVEIGGCSEGFGAFEAILRQFERQARVGQSQWRVYRAHDVLRAAKAAIEERPEVTRCGDRACDRCRDAVLGGPLIESGGGNALR
jgi:aminoglycoside 3-N-acetyltransferase